MDLSFAHPAGLFALLGIPALLVIHILQRRPRRVEITTLFLLEELPRAAESGSVWDRLRQSRLLWLQILAVLLLTWLLARPGWSRRESIQLNAVVLDSSASMQAFLPEVRTALRQEVGRLQDLAGRTEWIVLESDLARARVYRGADPEALLAAVDQWTPRSAHHNLNEILRHARSEVGPQGLVLLVSDRVPARWPGGVELLTVGKPVENAGFAGVSVDTRGGEPVWRALVANHTDRRQIRSYQVETESSRSAPTEIQLEPRGIVSLKGTWPPGQDRIRLILDPDPFPLDDALPLIRPLQKQLVIAMDTPQGADQLATRLVETLDTATEGSDERADLLIHARPSGGPVPDRSALCYIWSDGGGPPLQKGGVIVERHPLMDGLNWQGLLVPEGGGFEVRDSDTVLLWQDQRPLILLRTQGSRRQLILDFDLARSNADRLPALVLLFRRFAETVREEKSTFERRNVEFGQNLRIAALASGGSVEYSIGGSDPITVADVTTREVRITAPHAPGFFKVRQGDQMLFEGAAGFADVREADFTGASSTNSISQQAARVERMNRVEDPLAPLWMLLLAIILLLSWREVART